MSKELKLGDKVWMHYGPSVIIVGHIVDHSPDYAMLGISPLPYEDYRVMKLSERAGCPISWCDVKSCHYLSHIPREDLEEFDKSVSAKVGFLNYNSDTR
jgi:hypothetical protein